VDSKKLHHEIDTEKWDNHKVKQEDRIVLKEKEHHPSYVGVTTANPLMIEIIVNDRMGKKERIKCFPNDTVGNLKKLIAAKIGTRADKIRL